MTENKAFNLHFSHSTNFRIESIIYRIKIEASVSSKFVLIKDILAPFD